SRGDGVKGEAESGGTGNVAGHIGVTHRDSVASVYARASVGTAPGTAVNAVLVGHRLSSGTYAEGSIIGNQIDVVTDSTVAAVCGKRHCRGQRSSGIQSEREVAGCGVARHVSVTHRNSMVAVCARGGVGRIPGTAINTVFADHRLGCGADAEGGIVGPELAVVTDSAVAAVCGKHYCRSHYGCIQSESEAAGCRVARHVSITYRNRVAAVCSRGDVGLVPGTAIDTVLAGHRLGSSTHGEGSVVGPKIVVMAGSAIAAVNGKRYCRSQRSGGV